jgi:hypothetical protein
MNQDNKTNHNGWTNYVTWSVHLWLTNEQGSYLHWKKRTREILGDQSLDDENSPTALARLGDEIREAVHDECSIQRANLAADLMDAALSEVDWCEIAQEFIDDATPPSNRLGLFSLGTVVATPGVVEHVPHEDRINALARHSKGDWGDTCPEDWAENELSLKEGFRLLSIYHSKAEVKFWIITEADRSATTILLPEEY